MRKLKIKLKAKAPQRKVDLRRVAITPNDKRYASIASQDFGGKV